MSLHKRTTRGEHAVADIPLSHTHVAHPFTFLSVQVWTNRNWKDAHDARRGHLESWRTSSGHEREASDSGGGRKRKPLGNHSAGHATHFPSCRRTAGRVRSFVVRSCVGLLRLCVCSFGCLFVRSVVRSFVHSIVCSLARLPLRRLRECCSQPLGPHCDYSLHMQLSLHVVGRLLANFACVYVSVHAASSSKFGVLTWRSTRKTCSTC